MRAPTTCHVRHPRLVSAVAACLALFSMAACSRTDVGNGGVPVTGGRVVPASIPSDCSRDVTPDLAAWIGSVPDGSVLQFARNGCYRLDGTLHIDDRNNLTFDGNGATFKALTDGTELGPRGARGRQQLSIIRGSNITFQNLTVVGARALGLNQVGYDLEAQHAFVTGQTNGLHLNNVQAYDVYGDMVYIGPYTSNVLVEHSTFNRSGRQGWMVGGGYNIRFEGNYIANIGHATIDFEPQDTGSADGVTFSHNTIESGRLMFFSIGGAAVSLNNIRILDNELINKPMKVQAAAPGTLTNFTISGNHVTGPIESSGVDQSGGGAFFIQNATNVVVTNNRVSMTWGRNITGVNLGNSHNVHVTNNVWDGGSGSVSWWDGLNSNVCWSGNLAFSPISPQPSGGAC